MGCIDIKTIFIRDRVVRATNKVVDEVLDTLEGCYIWGSSISRETVDKVHKTRADVLHDMEAFSNTCNEFS